jgi:hypothetical protein
VSDSRETREGQAERLAWMAVWKRAHEMEAVAFLRWAEGSGYVLRGPHVEGWARKADDVQARFEEHKRKREEIARQEPLRLPTLTEDDWVRVHNYNHRDLTDAEERDVIARRNAHQPPGPGPDEDSDRFDEVAAEGDDYSHAWSLGMPQTFCGRTPIGLLPRPIGIYCPDCFAWNGMN